MSTDRALANISRAESMLDDLWNATVAHSFVGANAMGRNPDGVPRPNPAAFDRTYSAWQASFDAVRDAVQMAKRALEAEN